MHGVTCRVPVQTADESKRIHPGDLLLCVDGVDVTGKEAKAIETLIVGPYGSPIGLTLESGHDRERRSVRLSRKEHVTDRFIFEPQVSVWERTLAAACVRSLLSPDVQGFTYRVFTFLTVLSDCRSMARLRSGVS